MRFSVNKSEKYTVLVPEEEKLDSLKAPQLKAEIVTMFQSGTENLIIDLSSVKYVDSSGLSSILVANRLSTEVNGKLVLAGLNEHVMKLIKISKLESVLELHPTVQEAIEAIFLHEIEKDIEGEED
ncbi:STAS domain-containing protein [Flammeovirga yaeyamensis]|uniref:Anti-sigma factor antagonist n=1 Tax=Flammeovirga yaeyamensis TaxID=367791 RepID=A0AAX1N7B0_9BACT|nr:MULTISPECIES: STAS domain-containing protein [Flammeovirga]ANQ49142.1 STAS domain-containing protein [Flammeovirga sp. MY04]MBB3697995.1 anti-anti-sigma factor [Flammeovirga yaeyamensis]NMF35653.1 STAS domain-containing protein [Flammeovirga yaeyamensis]QWG03391.1 STAS domain-containing protein [Flammeovirga yaeyamensis]